MAVQIDKSSAGTSRSHEHVSEQASTKKDSLVRLMEKQLEEIDSVSKKIETWKQYKNDYESLKNLINQLQDKTSHPHRIPIAGTKLAFVDGHIIHTNELYVLLGYNYFTLRSSRQANRIVDRRLIDLKNRLKQSEEARKKAEDWFNVTKDHKRDKEQFVEIIETM